MGNANLNLIMQVSVDTARNTETHILVIPFIVDAFNGEASFDEKDIEQQWHALELDEDLLGAAKKLARMNLKSAPNVCFFSDDIKEHFMNMSSFEVVYDHTFKTRVEKPGKSNMRKVNKEPMTRILTPTGRQGAKKLFGGYVR